MSIGGLLLRERNRAIGLSRHTKRALLSVSDFLILSALLWAAMSVRYNEFYVPGDWQASLLLLAAPVLTVATFAWFGLYRFITRYIGSRGNIRIIRYVIGSVAAWALLVLMAGQQGVPRTVLVVYPVLAIAFISLSRQLVAWALSSSGIKPPALALSRAERNVIIYGAGNAGVQLSRALRGNAEREVVAFIDPSPTLWNQSVDSVKVCRPDRLARLIERHDVKEVLLAVPEQSRRERQVLIKELQAYPVEVKILPSIEQLASGRVRATDLRAVDVGDLLGRDPVPPDEALIARSILGKSVLVTGAGGSIGSEIVRQIIRRAPRQVVLLDISEAALYQIHAEIQQKAAALSEAVRPAIIAVLGSVLDERLVEDTLGRFEIEIIYHAAAYKHVPIVEGNVAVGLMNNVFGTATLAEYARVAGVERFVLISTDKAVRPHNVMGASKRLAELILQAHASVTRETVFTMVRFGNVLDSSGSVVPVFRKQIETGGPVTVTHPEVVRYFMSIPEAAELVLQAGSMAEGGEVFVLDMGEPIKIDALARLMIRLSGLEAASPENPDGDIRIEYTGLRPGEKLYEELLIGANAVATEHPRISRATEPFLEPAELEQRLESLSAALDTLDRDAILAELLRTVDGYAPNGSASDEIPGAHMVHSGPGSTMVH